MENIPATIAYPKFQLEWDLSLPVDVPMSVLLPQVIMKKCGTIDFLGADWQIRIRDSGDFIKPEQTLDSAGILPGDILEINEGFGDVPDFSKTTVVNDAKAVLIGASKSFPVNKKYTLIGRVDRKNGIFPEIDLTPLDKNARVSRRHAQIIINEDLYILRDLKSKHGTFVNGEQLDADARYELAAGDILRFGDTNSDIVMKFQKKL